MRPFFLGGCNGFLGTSRARSRGANHLLAMKRLFQFLAACFFALFNVLTFAATYPPQREWQNEKALSWHKSPEAACRSYVPKPAEGSRSFEMLGNPGTASPFCWYDYTNGNYHVSKSTYLSLNKRDICPSGTNVVSQK